MRVVREEFLRALLELRRRPRTLVTVIVVAVAQVAARVGDEMDRLSAARQQCLDDREPAHRSDRDRFVCARRSMGRGRDHEVNVSLGHRLEAARRKPDERHRGAEPFDVARRDLRKRVITGLMRCS